MMNKILLWIYFLGLPSLGLGQVYTLDEPWKVQVTTYHPGQKIVGSPQADASTLEGLASYLIVADSGEKIFKVTKQEKPYNEKNIGLLGILAPVKEMKKWDEKKVYIEPVFIFQFEDNQGISHSLFRFKIYTSEGVLFKDKTLDCVQQENEYRILLNKKWDNTEPFNTLGRILKYGLPRDVLALLTGNLTGNAKLDELIKLTRYEQGVFFSRLVELYKAWEAGQNTLFDEFFMDY